MNKKSFEVEMASNPKYGEVDRMHYIMNTDPAKMTYVRTVEQDFIDFKNRFQNIVHDLIVLQNRIFLAQQEFRVIDNPEKAGLDPKNVAKFIAYSKTLESNPDYDIFSTWEVKRKYRIQADGNNTQNDQIPETYNLDDISLTDIEYGDELANFNEYNNEINAQIKTELK